MPLTLPPKVLDLLFLLVSRPSSLVTKDDILQALWPDVAVTDNAITQVVSDLRQALGDSTASPRLRPDGAAPRAIGSLRRGRGRRGADAVADAGPARRGRRPASDAVRARSR